MVEDDLNSTKRSLEVKKLHLEIMYMRRTFWAQIGNTFAILALGAAALYFFQRPQISQMEAARLSNEKQYVISTVVSAYNMKDPKDRQQVLSILAQGFPEYPFVSTLLRGLEVVNSPTSFASFDSADERCKAIRARLIDARAAKDRTHDEVLKEISGLGRTGQMGEGPIANLLRDQEAQLTALERLLMRDMAASKCA
jgi:hypothetical protein